MLYIISAPSGAGKTSLVRELISRVENLVISVSHTTRPIRPHEINGVNYHFVDKAQFQKLLLENNFLEQAEVFGEYYGTSKAWVLNQIDSGKDVILEIDWQGAQLVRKIFNRQLSIFILPPSLEVLYERLTRRAQDSFEVIEHRMQAAKSECRHFAEFDYIVLNDDFDKAVLELAAIIQAQRLRTDIQRNKYSCLLKQLIAV